MVGWEMSICEGENERGWDGKVDSGIWFMSEALLYGTERSVHERKLSRVLFLAKV